MRNFGHPGAARRPSPHSTGRIVMRPYPQILRSKKPPQAAPDGQPSHFAAVGGYAALRMRRAPCR